jgi:hypothetical protein
VDNKGGKARKQHMGILEKMARLSENKRDQVRNCVEQAVSEEQLTEGLTVEQRPSEHDT